MRAECGTGEAESGGLMEAPTPQAIGATVGILATFVALIRWIIGKDQQRELRLKELEVTLADIKADRSGCQRRHEVNNEALWETFGEVRRDIVTVKESVGRIEGCLQTMMGVKHR